MLCSNSHGTFGSTFPWICRWQRWHKDKRFHHSQFALFPSMWCTVNIRHWASRIVGINPDRVGPLCVQRSSQGLHWPLPCCPGRYGCRQRIQRWPASARTRSRIAFQSGGYSPRCVMASTVLSSTLPRPRPVSRRPDRRWRGIGLSVRASVLGRVRTLPKIASSGRQDTRCKSA